MLCLRGSSSQHGVTLRKNDIQKVREVSVLALSSSRVSSLRAAVVL